MVIKLYSPINLDMQAVMKKNPFKKGKELKCDHLLFIIHCIMQQRAMKDDDYLSKRGKTGGYVPLSSKILQSKIPEYKECLDYLISAGIVECDGKYFAGKISKGYRLASQYRGQDFKKVPITHFILCRKISADDPFCKSIKSIKKLPYLAKWFKSGKLEIDEISAFHYLNQLELGQLHELNLNKSFTQVEKLEQKQILVEKFQNFKIQVSRIAEKNYHFHVDETGNRLHTNLTNLPKGVRDFLTYDGQPLASIDIKNSQPFMSIALLSKEFWQSKNLVQKPTLKRISKEIYKETGKDKKTKSNTIMLGHSSKTIVRLDSQKEEFIKSVVDGNFYEYLIDIFEKNAGMNLGSTHKEKRKEVKKMVMRIFFDDDNKKYNSLPNAPCQIFKRTFSSVAKIFAFIKKGNYTNLAIILQRIESFIILERICARFNKEKPELPLFTIHDSIVTTKGNEDYLQSVMSEELKKAIGKSPEFSIEYWGQNQILRIATAA